LQNILRREKAYHQLERRYRHFWDESGCRDGHEIYYDPQTDKVKLRRPAALAIVGWYLMAPPAKSTLTEQTTPLSAWNVIQSFDSATDYQDAKERDQQTSDKEVAGVDNGLGPSPGHNDRWTIVLLPAHHPVSSLSHC
jgi:hypothetical protein